MKRPVCRTCAKPVVHGNLYCSKACGQQPKAVEVALEAAGFMRDPETPNIYRKSGIAVTIEGANHVGIDKAVRNHAYAAEAKERQ